MKTLIVDNTDSFTYNLVQYVGELGGNPVVVEANTPKEKVDEMFHAGIDRIIISPGPGRPEDAHLSNHVIEKHGPDTPTLGVCLGHQCIGYVYGAKTTHAKKLMHGKTSKISHDGRTIYEGLQNPFEAGRYHSLAVEELPADLELTAKTEDGQIMGIRHRRYNIEGIQFHPESVLTPDGLKVVKNFLKEKK